MPELLQVNDLEDLFYVSVIYSGIAFLIFLSIYSLFKGFSK